MLYGLQSYHSTKTNPHLKKKYYILKHYYLWHNTATKMGINYTRKENITVLLVCVIHVQQSEVISINMPKSSLCFVCSFLCLPRPEKAIWYYRKKFISQTRPTEGQQMHRGDRPHHLLHDRILRYCIYLHQHLFRNSPNGIDARTKVADDT